MFSGPRSLGELSMYNTKVRHPDHTNGENAMDNKIVQVIAALFIPPLAVYIKKGKVDGAFWINVILTLLGGIPGVVHALYVVLT